MNPKRFSLLASLVLCASTPAWANLFVNGDFEINPGTGTDNARDFGTSGLTGWASTFSDNASHQNLIAGANRGPNTVGWVPTPQSGQFNVQLDSSQGVANYSIGNSIYQSVNLMANVPYTLTFAYHGETVKLAGDFAAIHALISLDSSPTNFLSVNYFTYNGYSLDGRPGVDPGWSLASVTFTPTQDGLYRFTFLDGGSAPGVFSGTRDNNMAIDNVSLEADLSAIPETSTWIGLGLLGTLALGWQHRAGLRGYLRRLTPLRA